MGVREGEAGFITGNFLEGGWGWGRGVKQGSSLDPASFLLYYRSVVNLPLIKSVSYCERHHIYM